MENIIVLTNNNQYIDLISIYINSLTPLQFLTFSYTSTRILKLYTQSEEEICNGTVIVKNNKIDFNQSFNKVENTNYSSAIITDQTFINNLINIYEQFKINMLQTTIDINGVSYNSNSYISINDKNYYVLNKI